MIDFLALYGATVGTIALALNFLRYKHTINSNKVQLKISYKKVKDYQKNIESMQNGYNPETGTGGNIAEVFNVTVLNLGDVDAYLKEVGIVSSNEAKHIALVSSKSIHNLLVDISVKEEILKPKSSRTFSIYQKKDEKSFEVKYAFVLDEMDKKWISK